MHKKDVLNAAHIPYSSMGKMHYINKDFNVSDVNELISGKHLRTVSCTISIGSNCGSQRVALSSYYVNCPVIANSNSTASRIIGLNKSPKSGLITLRSAMLFMTLPTFTRMVAC